MKLFNQPLFWGIETVASFVLISRDTVVKSAHQHDYLNINFLSRLAGPKRNAKCRGFWSSHCPLRSLTHFLLSPVRCTGVRLARYLSTLDNILKIITNLIGDREQLTVVLINTFYQQGLRAVSHIHRQCTFYSCQLTPSSIFPLVQEPHV